MNQCIVIERFNCTPILDPHLMRRSDLWLPVLDGRPPAEMLILHMPYSVFLLRAHSPSEVGSVRFSSSSWSLALHCVLCFLVFVPFIFLLRVTYGFIIVYISLPWLQNQENDFDEFMMPFMYTARPTHCAQLIVTTQGELKHLLDSTPNSHWGTSTTIFP